MLHEERHEVGLVVQQRAVQLARHPLLQEGGGPHHGQPTYDHGQPTSQEGGLQSWRKYLAKPAPAPLPSINVGFSPVLPSTACSSPTLMMGGGVGDPKECKTMFVFDNFFTHITLWSIGLANIFPP